MPREYSMTCRETREVLKEFDRDTRRLFVGLLGILFLAAWVCVTFFQAARTGVEAFVYFNNDVNTRAPSNALRLIELVGPFAMRSAQKRK
jgi:uncharacterized protein YecE (DUF72 family)